MDVFDPDVFEPRIAARCGARSYGQALFENGHAATFCGHHLTEHYDVLVAKGAWISDYRSRVLA